MAPKSSNGGRALRAKRGRKWFRFLGSVGAWKRWHEEDEAKVAPVVVAAVKRKAKR